MEHYDADPQPTLAERLRLPWLSKQPGSHVRAGYTKNKGQGQSKTRRRMADKSRRRNRA